MLKDTRLAPLGWAYFGLVWIGSVLLGWHWFFDGFVGAAGMLALWAIAPRLLFSRKPPVTAPAAVAA